MKKQNWEITVVSDLASMIGERFKKSRHGITQVVILEKVQRERVVYRDEHTQSTHKLSIAKFEKLFRHIPSRQ